MNAMNSGSPSAFGAILGVAIALSFIVPHFWIVALMGFLGFAIGKLWESEELRGKIKDIVSQIFS